MNTNIRIIKNQARQEKRSRKTKKNWKQLDCYPTNTVLADPYYFPSLRSLKSLILNYLIAKSDKHDGNVFVCQQTIATMFNCCRATVNRIIGELEREGLLLTNPRWFRSSLYKVTSWLFNLAIAFRLKKYLPALASCMLFSVFPNDAAETVLQTNVTHIYSLYIKRSRYPMVMDVPIEKGTRMNTISPSIKNFKSLSLTLRGQIELSPYPDEVIEKVDKIIATVRTPIRNPIAYARTLCRNICMELGKVPKWGIISQLLEQYGLPISEPCLSKPGINKSVIVNNYTKPISPSQPTKKNSHKQESRRIPAWRQESPVRYPPTEFAKRTPPEGTRKISPEELRKMLGI